LLASPYKKTAKAYIIYRDQHNRLRELASKAGVQLIDQYLEKLDWQVNENSNMAYSLQGLNNYIAAEVSKPIGSTRYILRRSARRMLQETSISTIWVSFRFTVWAGI
jgi:anaerobic ribonucleoside-triphosphate reductase